MKTILSIALSGICYAVPFDQIKRSLDSDQKMERTEAVADLNKIIDNTELSNEVRMKAMQLAVDMNVHECSGMIIRYIDTPWVRRKSIVPFEVLYPSVEALIGLGERTVPDLIKAIRSEDDELRHRLMSYALGRIMKQEAALAHLKKLLAADIPAAEKKRLEAARAVISIWTDRDAPDK